MRKLESLDNKEHERWRYFQEELIAKFERNGMPYEQAIERAKAIMCEQATLYEQERTKSFTKKEKRTTK